MNFNRVRLQHNEFIITIFYLMVSNRITEFCQAMHFSTKNPVNKPAMNNRRLLVAAVFHFVHPEEKDS